MIRSLLIHCKQPQRVHSDIENGSGLGRDLAREDRRTTRASGYRLDTSGFPGAEGQKTGLRVLSPRLPLRELHQRNGMISQLSTPVGPLGGIHDLVAQLVVRCSAPVHPHLPELV
jgi:hypothetical protein